jgi:benzaldehyde dehydrogenase (NAD)
MSGADVTLFSTDTWTDRIKLSEWTTGGGEAYTVTEPATGDELGRIGTASVDDVTRAVDAAVEAQKEWAKAGYMARAAVLRKAGDLWSEHAEEIHGWLVREAGSIPPKAEFETFTAAQECYEAAALASHPYGELLHSAQPRLSMARRLPVGVVGVIAPFNVPIVLAIRAVAPALALGNAVVLKPDLRTVISGGVTLAGIFEAAGLPPGLLTVLPGGVDVGEAIVVEPRLRVIAFTGSTRAGRAVGALAGQHLKRAHLELGGNSAYIVLGDADVDKAASAGAMGSFFHSGQVCMAASRHLVSADIVEAYTASLAGRADHLPVGNPATDQVALGPIIDASQRDKVHGIVTSSVDGGATLAAGGTYDRLFYRPTVLSDLTTDSPAYTEEIFGPVAPIISFDGVDELIELATGSDYGLSVGIIGRDLGKAMEIADRIPSGLVHINDQTINDEATIPFGGVGASGVGRQGGLANLEAFTETQWLTLRATPPDYPF